MQYLFSKCFAEDSAFESDNLGKELDPMVSIQGREYSRQAIAMHKVGIVPNKFTTRGNFLKAGFEANYENAANQTQKYLEFLDRKRSHYDLWGTSFRQKRY